MTKLQNIGLLLCLAAPIAACDDDDLELVDAGPDAGPDGGRRDGGSDAAVISIDAGLDASIDSAVPSDGSVADASTGTTWNVTLTKAAEIPACDAAGANATGTATVTLNAAGDTITVSVSYSGLSSPASNGHIHYGAAGASGPVVLPFGPPFDVSPIVRTLTASNYEPLGAAPATFAEFVSELKAGKAYVNIHTESCRPGEIRGQIAPQ